MGFEIINKIKKEKGLTNAQISKLSGVTLSTLDKITSGVNTNPKFDTLQAICRVLGCTLNDFYDSRPTDFFNLSEQGMIKKYRALDEHGKDIVNTVLDKEYEHSVKQRQSISVAARGGDTVEGYVDGTDEELQKLLNDCDADQTDDL